jgi:hypothetical protein
MVSSAHALLTRLGLTALLLPCAAACTPAFSERSSEIAGPRVLAVQSTPAEAAPSSPVSYRILVVDEKGTIAKPRVAWSFCTQPKPTDELNDVASACFDGGDIAVPLGMGASPSGMLPVNSCAQFGPDVPQPSSSGSSSGANQLQGRPTDPDSTGGYYQPVILNVAADGVAIPTLAETRVTCSLAGSTNDQFAKYTVDTRANENPELLGVTVPSQKGADLTAEDAIEPLVVATSNVLTLRANWPACPTTPSCGDGICGPTEDITSCPADCTPPVKGCGGSESYDYLDPTDHILTPRHETMRVSWFASAGSFDSDHTGREEADFAQTSSDNTWTAPADTGPVFMWVVLRDDRGGSDWQSFRVDVQ